MTTKKDVCTKSQTSKYNMGPYVIDDRDKKCICRIVPHLS